MKKKKQLILFMAISGLILCNCTSSYVPETYDSQTYMEGIGYDEPEEWYKENYQKPSSYKYSYFAQ